MSARGCIAGRSPLARAVSWNVAGPPKAAWIDKLLRAERRRIVAAARAAGVCLRCFTRPSRNGRICDVCSR